MRCSSKIQAKLFVLFFRISILVNSNLQIFVIIDEIKVTTISLKADIQRPKCPTCLQNDKNTSQLSDYSGSAPTGHVNRRIIGLLSCPFREGFDQCPPVKDKVILVNYMFRGGRKHSGSFGISTCTKRHFWIMIYGSKIISPKEDKISTWKRSCGRSWKSNCGNAKWFLDTENVPQIQKYNKTAQTIVNYSSSSFCLLPCPFLLWFQTKTMTPMVVFTVTKITLNILPYNTIYTLNYQTGYITPIHYTSNN